MVSANLWCFTYIFFLVQAASPHARYVVHKKGPRVPTACCRLKKSNHCAAVWSKEEVWIGDSRLRTLKNCYVLNSRADSVEAVPLISYPSKHLAMHRSEIWYRKKRRILSFWFIRGLFAKSAPPPEDADRVSPYYNTDNRKALSVKLFNCFNGDSCEMPSIQAHVHANTSHTVSILLGSCFWDMQFGRNLTAYTAHLMQVIQVLIQYHAGPIAFHLCPTICSVGRYASPAEVVRYNQAAMVALSTVLDRVSILDLFTPSLLGGKCDVDGAHFEQNDLAQASSLYVIKLWRVNNFQPGYYHMDM